MAGVNICYDGMLGSTLPDFSMGDIELKPSLFEALGDDVENAKNALILHKGYDCVLEIMVKFKALAEAVAEKKPEKMWLCQRLISILVKRVGPQFVYNQKSVKKIVKQIKAEGLSEVRCADLFPPRHELMKIITMVMTLYVPLLTLCGKIEGDVTIKDLTKENIDKKFAKRFEYYVEQLSSLKFKPRKDTVVWDTHIEITIYNFFFEAYFQQMDFKDFYIYDKPFNDYSYLVV